MTLELCRNITVKLLSCFIVLISFIVLILFFGVCFQIHFIKKWYSMYVSFRILNGKSVVHYKIGGERCILFWRVLFHSHSKCESWRNYHRSFKPLAVWVGIIYLFKVVNWVQMNVQFSDISLPLPRYWASYELWRGHAWWLRRYPMWSSISFVVFLISEHFKYVTIPPEHET